MNQTTSNLDPALQQLLGRADIWRGHDAPGGADGEPTGFTALDARLPAGGWPRGALTELLPERGGLAVETLRQRGGYPGEPLHLPATALFYPGRADPGGPALPAGAG